MKHCKDIYDPKKRHKIIPKNTPEQQRKIAIYRWEQEFERYGENKTTGAKRLGIPYSTFNMMVDDGRIIKERYLWKIISYKKTQKQLAIEAGISLSTFNRHKKKSLTDSKISLDNNSYTDYKVVAEKEVNSNITHPYTDYKVITEKEVIMKEKEIQHHSGSRENVIQPDKKEQIDEFMNLLDQSSNETSVNDNPDFKKMSWKEKKEYYKAQAIHRQ